MESPKLKLYPERPSEGIDEKISELKALESRGTPHTELSESERGEIFTFEKDLGLQLEPIYAIKSVSLSVHLDYLQTPAGKKDFEDVFQLALPEEVLSHDELQEYLYEQTPRIIDADSKLRGAFAGRARKYVEEEIRTTLMRSLTEDAQIDPSTITSPVSTHILLTPEKSLDKINQLRSFKTLLKGQYATLGEGDSETLIVKRGIIDLYLKRVNELLADVSQSGRSLRRKDESNTALTEIEQKLLNETFDVDDHNRIAARYDRFKHGATTKTNADGYYPQISEQLTAYTERYTEAYNQSVVESSTRAIEKGLDPELIADEDTYKPEQIREFAEEVLQSYSMLSTENPEMYTPDRQGPAKDGKCQVIVSEQYASMSFDSRQRVVKIPKKPMSARKLFPVALAHEIEGHALQHTNKAELGLRLFNTVGSDRSVIFAEGGAMFNQDHVSREAFDIASSPHPHYIRAMRTKLEGGTYVDCVHAIYESALEPYRTLHANGNLTTEKLHAEAKKQLRLAVRRARRLFKGGDYENKSGQLSNSKDTAYLEGFILSEKLQEADLQKYLYLSGVNLDALIFLLKHNLISTDAIKAPMFTSLQIWERERPKFLLRTA